MSQARNALARTDRWLAADSRTARSIARARESIPGGTCSFSPLPAVAGVAWLDRIHRGLMEAGVIIPHRGLSCLSTPMDTADVDRVLAGFEQAVAALRQQRRIC
jgi:glutamate-1-semialdehyde aminotransferase